MCCLQTTYFYIDIYAKNWSPRSEASGALGLLSALPKPKVTLGAEAVGDFQDTVFALLQIVSNLFGKNVYGLMIFVFLFLRVGPLNYINLNSRLGIPIVCIYHISLFIYIYIYI